MATLGDLTDEVIHNLSGYSTRADAMASTVADITESALGIRVDDIGNFAKGIIQIESELVYVSGVDSTTSTLTVPAWGRGFRGSQAVPHLAGAQVSVAPSWPRVSVAHAINQTIRSLYPTLFAISNTESTVGHGPIVFEVPGDCERVLEVYFLAPGLTAWHRVREWNLMHNHPIGNTGIVIEVYGGYPPGTTIGVSYATAPRTIADENGEWWGTGLPENYQELVILGATYRLLPALDAVRLPRDSASAVEADAQNQVGSAVALAKTYVALFQDRLQQEAQVLNDRYPIKYRRMR